MSTREQLDIAANRRAAKYSRKVLIMRVLWAMVGILFRFSPKIFWGWRSSLLRLFGAKVGRNAHVNNSAVIYMPWNLEIGDWSAIGEHAYIYNLGRITIGSRVTISHRAHLCAGTHDYSDPTMSLLKPPIIVGDQSWICTDAFIGPGVTVGEGAVAGARAVVVKDVEPWSIVAGNPAKFVKKRIIRDGL